MVKNLAPTSYRKYVESVAYESDDSTMKKANTALTKIFHNQPISDGTVPVVYLLDMTQKQYVTIGSNVRLLSGDKPEYFLKGGLESAISRWKNEDFELMNNKMFPEWMRIIGENVSEVSNLIFSLSYDFLQKDGTPKKVLDRFSMITDASNTVPIGVIGTVTDIAQFNRDKSRICTVEQACGDETKLLYKHVYFHNQLSPSVTRKEREVLGHLADGLSSKQIAAKLYLSESTIINHRKNILRKTNTKNVAELIRYSIESGFI